LKKKEQIPTVVVYHHPYHIDTKVIKARACASTHLCTSRAPDKKPIKRCMEDYHHYGKISSYRNNPMATPT
jgi:hypothetical protein